jgi:lipopolysaccharide export system ATP-binding protein
MRIDEFVATLRPQDASLAAALAELVRRADANGSIDRGEWLASLSTAWARLTHAESGNGEAGPADAANSDPEGLSRYLDDNILARLQSEGIATGEPAGEGWERAVLDRSLWSEISGTREQVAGTLDSAVRNLLDTGDRRAHADDRGERISALVEGGSTLEARGLVKAYRRRRVVADVHVQVAQGEIVGLLGPNGAGKTTTFYMMVGLIGPDDGQVFLDDKEITKTPMFKRARAGIGYLAQEPSIFRKMTVEENIRAILETMPLKRAEKKERLERLLDDLGLKHLRKAKAYSLSGGERRRLEITRALVSDPKFMLLDEPFAGVDPIAVHDIQQIVADLRHRGIGVIITDHNVEQTLDIVDRAYIMYDGKVRVSGTVRELVWNEEVAEIYFGPTLTARMRQRYPRPEVAV